MGPPAGQNAQKIRAHPPQDARKRPTNTKNIRAPVPNRPRSCSWRALAALGLSLGPLGVRPGA
eukprot:8204631-Pyramimonas_sp.AAC.1